MLEPRGAHENADQDVSEEEFWFVNQGLYSDEDLDYDADSEATNDDDSVTSHYHEDLVLDQIDDQDDLDEDDDPVFVPPKPIRKDRASSI